VRRPTRIESIPIKKKVFATRTYHGEFAKLVTMAMEPDYIGRLLDRRSRPLLATPKKMEIK